MENPINALVVRKVGNTIRDSVFEQLKEAIELLGVEEEWQSRVSPLSLTYMKTGTRIIFRGGDKPKKIKSIKSSTFPIAILWIEEVDEFRSEDEVGVIVNSVIRAELDKGLKYTILLTYNPPKRKQNWVNKKYNTQFTSKNVFVHHSTYFDNPFVSQTFIEEAEELKLVDEHRYKWIYLGEPIGGGVLPFNNLEFREITDEEIETFDTIRQGIDWGYASDPYTFIRWHYDRTRETVYAIDEHYGVKISNEEAANWIKKRDYHYITSTADSAEPKSIADLMNRGIPIVGAVKGPGSVESGEKWLDELKAIVIDYRRTPNCAKEFEDIDYQVDKDGNMKNKLEDKFNHTIDATRYAFESEMGQGGQPVNNDIYQSFGGSSERSGDSLW